MSDHTRAIVPLESWSYSAPELRASGTAVDIGLFAEALLYYERLAINITTQPQLAEFLAWFLRQGQLDNLLAMIRDGVVQIYDYGFHTTSIFDERSGEYSFWNIQDQTQEKPNTYEQRFLYHKALEELIPKARHRARLYEAFRGRVIEVKAADFGNAIENAREDSGDARRVTLNLQAFVDELYRFRRLGRPPEVQGVVQQYGHKNRISWNVDLDELTSIAGPNLAFNVGTVLSAGGHSNRLIWSAAQLECDLYLARPMGMLVGDKLYESAERIAKAGDVIQDLKEEVEFPDVRGLVNSGQLDFQTILKIRGKAHKFRRWLQQESERDRNAIIAYHNEAARDSGLVTAGRRALSIFGAIGGSIIGAKAAGPAGSAVGSAVGSAAGYSTSYLVDLVAKMGANWKPVVFGNWMGDRIEKVVGGKKSKKAHG